MVAGFYHSDRPLTQQALARALSYSLVPSLPRESRLRFLRAFWTTIGREFHALDRLRLDKYLFLIRCYVGVAFEVFLKGRIAGKAEDEQTTTAEGQKKRKRGGKGESDESTKKRRKKPEEDGSEEQQQDQSQQTDGEKWAELESYISVLEDGPLCPLNFDPDESEKKKKKKKRESKNGEDDSIPMPHGPDGLRYHIIDIWLDELAKVIDPVDSAEKKEEAETSTLKDRSVIPMDLLLRPFEKLKAESPTKSVRLRAKGEVLDDQRLIEWGFRTRPVEDEDEDEEEWGGFGE